MSNNNKYYLFKDIKVGLKFIRVLYDSNNLKSVNNILCIVTKITESTSKYSPYQKIYSIEYMYFDNSDKKIRIDKASLDSVKKRLNYYINDDSTAFGEGSDGGRINYYSKMFKFYFKKPIFTDVYPIEGKFYNVQAILSDTVKIFSIRVNTYKLYKTTLIKSIIDSLKENTIELEKFLKDNVYGGVTGFVSNGTTINFLFNGSDTVFVIVLGKYQILRIPLSSEQFRNTIISPLSSNKVVSNYNSKPIGVNAKNSNRKKTNRTISNPIRANV
jgi:hypothetical protein